MITEVKSYYRNPNLITGNIYSFPEKDISRIITKYQGGISLRELSLEYSVSIAVIQRILLTNGIAIRGKGEARRILFHVHPEYTLKHSETTKRIMSIKKMGISLSQGAIAKRSETVRKKTLNKIIEIDKTHRLCELYKVGYSLSFLSKNFNISSNLLKEYLSSKGISLRIHSETIRILYQSGLRKALVMENNPNWKGGRSGGNGDYVFVRKIKGKGYTREHIVIWERANNMQLPNGWIVHHLNGIKDDNRIENLIALSSRNHSLVLREKAKRIKVLETENVFLRTNLLSPTFGVN